MAENEILQSTAVDENNDYNASEIQVLEGLEAVRKRLVDGVIHNFVDEVMQAARGRGADIHARALAHRLKPFEHLDL